MRGRSQYPKAPSLAKKVRGRSVDARHDAIRHASDVLLPKGFVFLSAAPVVVVLARNEQRHVVERVEPWREVARVPEGERKADRHQKLAEIVHVTCDAPEAID